MELGQLALRCRAARESGQSAACRTASLSWLVNDSSGFELVLAVLCPGGFCWFAVAVEVVAEYLFEKY